MSVHSVYQFQNGMYMVFDDNGDQIPELQGTETPELRAKIKAAIDEHTIWRENCKWAPGYDKEDDELPSAQQPYG